MCFISPSPHSQQKKMTGRFKVVRLCDAGGGPASPRESITDYFLQICAELPVGRAIEWSKK
jgi:hypothetical protein